LLSGQTLGRRGFSSTKHSDYAKGDVQYPITAGGVARSGKTPQAPKGLNGYLKQMSSDRIKTTAGKWNPTNLK